MEVKLNAAGETALRAAMKPPGEIVSIGGREALVSLLLCEVHDRLGPQTAIEMVVKEDLGQGPNERLVNLGRHRLTVQRNHRLINPLPAQNVTLTANYSWLDVPALDGRGHLPHDGVAAGHAI